MPALDRVALLAVLGVVTLHLPSTVHAVGSAEFHSYKDFLIGRNPLALSRDGNWVVHVDENGNLVRSHTRETGKAQSVKLPGKPSALAASRTAQVVAFAAGPDCIGTVSFAAARRGKNAPEVKLLANRCGVRELTYHLYE